MLRSRRNVLAIPGKGEDLQELGHFQYYNEGIMS